mgnify:CR=1 FL=1
MKLMPLWDRIFIQKIFYDFQSIKEGKMKNRISMWNYDCDAGRWKTLGGPVVIGGDNLPSPVELGFTELPNIGGASGPPGPPGSGTTDLFF